MTVNLSGSLWLWTFRLLALLYTLIILFHIAVPEVLLGIVWLALLILSFVTITGQSSPPG